MHQMCCLPPAGHTQSSKQSNHARPAEPQHTAGRQLTEEGAHARIPADTGNAHRRARSTWRMGTTRRGTQTMTQRAWAAMKMLTKTSMMSTSIRSLARCNHPVAPA